MPGPPPSPNARRRNARAARVKLPAGGRQGEPPPFPLTGRSKALVELWAGLWSSPQAVVWEQLGWTRIVARYAKLILRSERRDADRLLLAEVRQLEDRLGLTPLAMRRLQWEIADDVEPMAAPTEVTVLEDYRARLEKGA